MIPPDQVKSPRSLFIGNPEVIYDGTTENGLRFSLAKMNLRAGGTAICIRHDYNELNPNNPDLGYPNIRGHATWFVLPNLHELLPILNLLQQEGRIAD